LVPSRLSLLEDIDEVFQILFKTGLRTLSDLRKRLKTPKRLAVFASESGIDPAYLTLLRREIESYFPKAFPLRDFDWIPASVRQKLESAGLTDSRKVFEAFVEPGKVKGMSSMYDIEESALKTLSELVDLTRIQWMSPLSARLMVEAGYPSANSIKTAKPEALCQAVEAVNRKNGYFKGKIGLRDIKRLLHAAKYVDYQH